MSDNTTVNAVIFDMDGLLLDSETLAMDALVISGRELGYDMPDDFCQAMIGMPADRCREMVVETYGAEFPLEAFFEGQEKALHRLVEEGALTTKKGVEKLLDLLDQHQIPRAIATSSSRYRTDRHLEKAGLDGRFNAIISRDDVSQGKPHAEPYLTAAKALGVAPAHCLALEDSYNGIRAAHAAGIRVMMVPDLLPPTDEMRELAFNIVDNLEEVAEWLAPRLASA
ncbi:HAD family hydrolase [Carnimonas nigrificans]|uniref:HAD family hydrolase n=1 Tax=Carnimonas nigrificans TaxID=64323 RepID=UPI0004712EA6|nr:HAD family phosphatase [Carnimonas nigrificans]